MTINRDLLPQAIAPQTKSPMVRQVSYIPEYITSLKQNLDLSKKAICCHSSIQFLRLLVKFRP